MSVLPLKADIRQRYQLGDATAAWDVIAHRAAVTFGARHFDSNHPVTL